MLDFSKNNGLVAAVVQDAVSGEVLMVAYMDRQAWEKTVATGRAHFWSRSRQKLWMKGETSGHVQVVKAILVDCDGDAVVLKVEQLGGAACHTGYRSCFYRQLDEGKLKVVGEKVFDPEEVYQA